MEYDITQRKYIAISIKHSKPNDLWFWGTRTKDNQDRCFAGYNHYEFKDGMCELYALQDFPNHGYGKSVVKSDAPVPMTDDLLEQWEKYDTVLVCEEDYLHWISMKE